MKLHLVVDLEATCSDDGSIPLTEMEIIEIGAVLVNADSYRPLGQLQSFVRPVRHPVLTEFCTGLTGIRQADVDGAPFFPEALQTLIDWLPGGRPPLFCCWGDYDRRQIAQDCVFHNIPDPFGNKHLNLKALFAQRMGMRKRPGMAKALKRAGLPLEGSHHRALDDARNIAQLIAFTLRRV